MDLKSVWILSLLFFTCCFQQSHAFNITDLLYPFPDLSAFNNYITQAQLATEINARQTITVLAVDNGGLGSISGEGINVVRTIISIHILLDYFDAAKFRSMSGSTLTPTLFQTTGKAAGQQGFVNISVASGGAVLFGSGVEGSSPRASLVKTVVAQPYNISILQISSLIYPKGIQPPPTPPTPPPPPPPPPPTTSSPPPPTTSSPPPPTTSSPPPPPPTTTSPPSANTTSPPPANTTSPPSPTTTSPPSPSPSRPVKAPSPAAGSPKTAPSKSPKTAPSTASAPSPAVDGPLADTPAAPDKAGSSTLRFGGSLILTLVAISSWLTIG